MTMPLNRCIYPQVREDGHEEVETVDSKGKWDHLNTIICGLPGAADTNPQVGATIVSVVSVYFIHKSRHIETRGASIKWLFLITRQTEFFE